MYRWLAQQIAAARQPHLHLVEGPADEQLHQAIGATKLAAPRSYKVFVLELGNCRLFRVAGSDDEYLLEVMSELRQMQTRDGTTYEWFGSYQNRPACFRGDLLAGERESPVFEWHGGNGTGRFRETAPGFRPWLKRRFGQARQSFSE
ncbi:MAG: hypothetical protein WD872_09765 [Pirellulaceae bacterium]